MRKITTICSSLLLLVLSSVNSMALPQLNLSMPSFNGVGIGVSGTAGAWFAAGTEKEGTTNVGNVEHIGGSDAIAIGHSSVFLEYSIERLNGLTIGIDYVPDTLSTNTKSRVDTATSESGASHTDTNSVQVDFKDLMTLYIEVPILSTGFHLKGGMKSVDVRTNENLTTGSTYSDGQMDGEMIGLGFKHKFDNSVFLKADMTYTNFGTLSITSGNNDNSVTATLEGVQGTLSLGKSF